MDTLKQLLLIIAILGQFLGIGLLFVNIKLAIIFYIIYVLVLIIIFVLLVYERKKEKEEDDRNDYRNY